jgi:hypothetical protein
MRTHLLREFQLRRRENVLYTYDFLDLWEWEIRVLDIEPGSPEAWRPRCLAGRAATPPEECGAQRGYMRILDQHKHYPPMAEQELVENALQCVAGVLPDQSPSRLAQGAARSIHKSRQFTASAVCCRLMSSKLRISMGENCGKQDAFRDGVLSGTDRRWGGGSVQTVIVPLFALSEIRSQTRQNCAEIGPSDARLLSGRLRFRPTYPACRSFQHLA